MSRKKFRLNPDQIQALKESMNDIKNDVIKDIAKDVVNNHIGGYTDGGWGKVTHAKTVFGKVIAEDAPIG